MLRGEGKSTSPSVISSCIGTPKHSGCVVITSIPAERAKRPQRLQLASPIPIVFRRLNGERVAGELRCVSRTGGLVVPAALLQPGSMVRLIFVTPKGPVTGRAEMLQPVSRTEQPFRFETISDSDQRRLSAVIDLVYGDNL